MKIVIDIPDEIYKELTETAIMVTDAYPLTIERALTEGKPYEERKGKWVHLPNVWGVVFCSECNYDLRINDTKYCPNCGVKMEVNE